jgi:hypothetical protein
MTQQINEPNQFSLCGVEQKHKDLYINYSTTSITGKLVFDYKDSKSTQSFTGDEIRYKKRRLVRYSHAFI